jgi:hypothetical protein
MCIIVVLACWVQLVLTLTIYNQSEVDNEVTEDPYKFYLNVAEDDGAQ